MICYHCQARNPKCRICGGTGELTLERCWELLRKWEWAELTETAEGEVIARHRNATILTMANLINTQRQG